MAKSQHRSRPWSFWSSLAGAVVVLMLAAVVLGLQAVGVFGGDDVSADGALSVDLEAVDVSSTTVAGSGAESSDAESDDQRPPDENQISTSLTQDGVTSITMMLTDPSGASRGGSDAELQLNAETGQICYSLTTVGISAPYETTIRRGLAGADGAVVVDLGEQAAMTIDCDPGDVAAVAAILDDPTGHYLELRDAFADVTLRSQLAASDTAQTGGLMLDPDGGGATARMADGVVTLVGVVANQQVADDLEALFSPPEGGNLTLVSELRLVSDAPPPSGRMLVTGDIAFEISSDQIVAVEGTVIEDLIEFLVSRPDWEMLIVGHTDATGEEAFNVDLSQRRAAAVRDALVAGGVSADGIEVEGAGSAEPIADNSTAEGRAENRRIEFSVTPAGS